MPLDQIDKPPFLSMRNKREEKFKNKRANSESYVHLMKQWKKERLHNSFEHTQMYQTHKRARLADILNENNANSEFNQCL